MTDELHLQELGERKIALFCCIPDSDKSLNYLVGMIYTQLIQTLYRQADRVHKGRLPVPVHCLMDEYANISLPKDTFCQHWPPCVPVLFSVRLLCRIWRS